MYEGLVRASRLASPAASSHRSIVDLIQRDPAAFVSGAIVQISGTAVLSVAVHIAGRILHTASTPMAWVSDGRSVPYPPDLHAAGIDLRRLLILRLQDPDRRLQALDRILRARICGLVVFDLTRYPGDRPDHSISPGVLGRFMHMCDQSGTGLLLLTPGDVGAVSPAVRVHVRTTSEPVAGTERWGGSDGLNRLAGRVTLTLLRTRSPMEGGVLDGRFTPDLC